MKVLIVTGGRVTIDMLDKEYDDSIDVVMAVDGGLAAIDAYNEYIDSISGGTDEYKIIKVDCAVGDFDTVDKKLLARYTDSGMRVKRYAPEKDYTDTHIALEEAIDLGADELVIIGAIGYRMDHTLANIDLLRIALEKGLDCVIADDHNRIRLIQEETTVSYSKGKYVSIIPFSMSIQGITLIGFKYPLDMATINKGETIGISNEVLLDKGIIRIEEGLALVIQAKD